MTEVLRALFFLDVRDAWDVVAVLICWVVIILTAWLAGLILSSLGYFIYRIVAYDYTIETMQAKVIAREYRGSYRTYVSNGKSLIPIHHSAEYNIKLRTLDHDLEDIINDEEMYDALKEGDVFKVKMKLGRDQYDMIKYWRVLEYFY